MSNRYGKAIRHEWDLDPDFLTLNHGSYGATPREVLAGARILRAFAILGVPGHTIDDAASELRFSDTDAMARAMKLGVQAGREAYLAGRIARKFAASPSSPTGGLIGKP